MKSVCSTATSRVMTESPADRGFSPESREGAVAVGMSFDPADRAASMAIVDQDAVQVHVRRSDEDTIELLPTAVAMERHRDVRDLA